MTKDQYIFEKLELGCWHEFGKVYGYCIKCKHNIPSFQHYPDFTTWEGFGKLWEKMREHERWEEFVDYCWENAGEDITIGDVDGTWAGIPFRYIHPTRFRDAVADFLGREEE